MVAPEHDRLLASSTLRSVFLTADFLQPWFDVFGGRHDLVNLAFRRDGRLIGSAPLAVQAAAGRPPLRRLVMAGQSPTSGEHLDLVAEAGSECEVAEALADQLTGPYGRCWDVMTIQRVLTDARGIRRLAEALEARGCEVELVATGTSPFTVLPLEAADLLTGKSKNFRDQVKQSRNRVARLGEVRLVEPGDDECSHEEAFDRLVELHRVRWADRSSFDTPDKIRFHREVSRRLSSEDRLYLALLLVDGQPVAARYDFVHEGKLWCIQGGWDPVHASARPGLFMTEAAMRWAISRRLREYDFLAGEGDYKQRWSTGSRDLMTVVAINPSTVRGRALPWLRRGRAAGAYVRTVAARARSGS